MGTPAAVAGDRITGICPEHLLASPIGPIPAGPLPFSAPVLVGVVPTVLITGKPVVVVGSSGLNTPPHVGLADAFAAPTSQVGRVLVGSPTVLAGGRPLARLGSSVTLCATPGVLAASATSVLVA